jgi:hypothetical protein
MPFIIQYVEINAIYFIYVQKKEFIFAHDDYSVHKGRLSDVHA